MKNAILPYVKSGHPGIYLVSPEETRVEAEIKAVARQAGHSLYAWSVTDGLVNTRDGSVRPANEPMEAIAAIPELGENAIVLLRDFHLFLEDANPVLLRALKDELARAKTQGRTLVVVGCRQILPPELEREFVVLDFALPGKSELEQVVAGICESAKVAKPKGEALDAILEAATGMTCAEAENALALSLVETQSLDPVRIAHEKAQAVRKGGILELVEDLPSLASIGGLDLLKDWLTLRKDAFGRKAQEYGLPTPKGLLLVGVPGTGKSLAAKATASLLGRPLLKLDAGRLYGGLVGQSEGNLRSVIQTAEAIAPCVLWIDEIEKAFAGGKSSGMTDGGTSSRVFGSFLSWMQEKKSPVFVVATANDVAQLPPEFLRKGRFDELFFVDLPSPQEREAIWGIQIGKYGRKPKGYNLGALAVGSEGFTGAEIEQAFIEGLYEAFGKGREPDTVGLGIILAKQVPLSRLMGEQIALLRQWAQGRARPATRPEAGKSGRKMAA
ncbi:MAG: AAA family ATPase [Planctomycetes bacterium]|nr:AAA family ATPase [Planctomycetota bacterium]